MKGQERTFKVLMSRKYGFWFYQLVGWGIYVGYDLSATIPQKDHGFGYLVFVLCSLSSAFIISLALRLLYRKFYDLWKNTLQKFLMTIVFSVLAGLVWYILLNLLALVEYFEYPSLFNNELKFNLKQIYRNIVFLTWPLLVWSVLYFLIKSRNEFQDEKEKAIQSQLLAKDAQLRALRYQINPHFLFNTLISIQGLMYHNTRMADKMLTELSEFLRYTLRYNQMVFVPLEDEFEIVEKYLTIQKIRFGAKLTFTFSIAKDTNHIQILCFLLQPLVENAIEHGMKTSPNGITILISTEINENWLTLKIINTGIYNPDKHRVGTGIANVRERLENAYPNHHKFEIYQENDKVHVLIKLYLST